MVVGVTRGDDSFSRIQDLASALKGRLGIPRSKALPKLAKSRINTEKIIEIAHEIALLTDKFNNRLTNRLSDSISYSYKGGYISNDEYGARHNMRLKVYREMKLTYKVITDETYTRFAFNKSFRHAQEFREFLAKISPYLKAQDPEELINIVHIHYPEKLFSKMKSPYETQIDEDRNQNERTQCLDEIARYKTEYEELHHKIISEIDNFKNKYSPVGDLKQTLIDELKPKVEALCPEKTVVLARLSMLEIQSPNFSEEFFPHLDEIIQLVNPESKKAGIEVSRKRYNAHSLSYTNLNPLYEQIQEQASIVDPYLRSTSSFTFAKLIADNRMREDLSYVLKNFPSNLVSEDREEFGKYFIDNLAPLQETFKKNHSQGENRGQEFYEKYLKDLSVLASAKIQASLNTKFTSNFNNSSINPNTVSGEFTVKYLSNLAVNAIMEDFSEKIIIKAFPDDEQAALRYRDLTQERIDQINSDNEKLLLAQKQYLGSLDKEKNTTQAISVQSISMEKRKSLLKQGFANYQGTASALPEIYLEVINKLNAENAELNYPSNLNSFLSQYARQKHGLDRAREAQVTTALIQELSSSISKYDLNELKVEAGKYLKEYLKKNPGLDSKSFGVAEYERIYESFARMDQGSLKARALSLKDFKATHNPDQKFWEDLFSVNSFNQAYSEKIQSVIELAKNLSNFDNSILYNILMKTGLTEDKVFNFIDNLKDFTKFNFAVQEKFAKDFIEAVGDAVVEKLIANSASIATIDNTVNGASPELSSSIGANTPASEELAIEHFGRFTDNLIRLFDDSDQELIQFIENQAVKKIWLSLFKSNPEINSQADIEEFGIDCKSSLFMQKIYSKFKKEFEQIKNTELPVNYNTANPIRPNLMQRYVAFKLNEIGHFANWSNPGSGKTLSAIYSAMLNEASDTKSNGHNILVIGANSTIENEEEWAASISSFDKKAEILNKADYESSVFKTSDRNKTKNNYFLYNYEAFQADKSESLVNALSAKTFDTIIVDEVHLIKSADSKRNAQISALIQKARESNPELKVLVMSATPIVNNLDEGKEIIKVLTGLDRLDIDTSKVSSKTILDMNRLLMNTGIRFEKAYPQKLEVKKLPIILDLAQSFDRPLIQEIIDSINKAGRSLLDLEQSLSKAKRSTVLANVSPGTIVYSKFVSGIIDEMAVAIQESRGLEVGLYTGENKAGYQAFKNRLAGNSEAKIDVLVASSALGLGVNLQDTGHSMIINSLPWSAAEMEQLLGRIYREGSNAEKISVIIPLVYLRDVNGEMFSYDEKRLSLIETKGALADLVLSGEPLRDEFSSEAKLLVAAEQAVSAWQEQIQAGIGLDVVHGVQIATDMRHDLKRDFQAGSGLLSPSAVTHKLLSTASSKTVGKYYEAHPEEWDLIHKIYDKYESEWGRDNVPRNVLARRINSIVENANQKSLGLGEAGKVFTIGDFGCGKFQLASQLNQSMTKVYGFDYISADPSNPNIISCDMANIPRKDSIKDGLLDIAVFSLSLHHDSLRERQGAKSFLNIPNYLSEANKLLKARGTLMIALPRHNWSGERLGELMKDINESGFKIQMTGKGKPVRCIGSDKFMYIFATKSGKK
jgi:superfamily II DNA or RNA helicase